MKKVKVTTILLIVLFVQIAQAQQVKTTTTVLESGVMQVKDKITFPPNCKNTKITLVGRAENALVLENEKGEKLLLNSNNGITILESKKRWTPVVPKPHMSLNLIGTTDNGTPVWVDLISKTNCTLDIETGKKRDYVGHVTLLK